VQALQAELAASKGTPPAPAPGGGSDDSPEEVKYGLVIPQEVQAALLSEKPEDNVAAITHIINGLAKHVHQRIIAEVDSRLLNIVGSQSQDAALRQQQEVIKNAQEEYFIAFNEHRDPLIAPYIQQAAGELATEFPNLPWNEQYIAALGARVNSKLAAIRGAVPAPPAPPAPAPAPPSPPQPASMMPFGARTGQDAVEQDADLINDTFTWGN
jgi:hypothetical protein